MVTSLQPLFLRRYDHVCTGYLAFRQLSVTVGGDTGGALKAAEQMQKLPESLKTVLHCGFCQS